MEHELDLAIILNNPTPGVDFGIQKGKGNDYQTIQKQRGGPENLLFHLKVRVKIYPDKPAVFLGPFVHGPSGERFIYIDIGTAAGQVNTPWSRRLKIPLNRITLKMIDQIVADQTLILQTEVPGTGKDGGPNCGTVKPLTVGN